MARRPFHAPHRALLRPHLGATGRPSQHHHHHLHLPRPGRGMDVPLHGPGPQPHGRRAADAGQLLRLHGRPVGAPDGSEDHDRPMPRRICGRRVVFRYLSGPCLPPLAATPSRSRNPLGRLCPGCLCRGGPLEPLPPEFARRLLPPGPPLLPQGSRGVGARQ